MPDRPIRAHRILQMMGILGWPSHRRDWGGRGRRRTRHRTDRSGVTTRGKAVREATEANSKLMAAILTALTESGISQKDVQTAQLSIQPVYASPEPGKEQKLVGYSVRNHINAKIKHIDRLGDVLDRMIAAGATEVWNLEFLLSDPSKALDQAREAAIADARRKAGVYARAAGVTLGHVVSIEEEFGILRAGVKARTGSAGRCANSDRARGEHAARYCYRGLQDRRPVTGGSMAEIDGVTDFSRKPADGFRKFHPARVAAT